MKKIESQVCSFEQSSYLGIYEFNIDPCFYWRMRELDSKPELISYRANHDPEEFAIFPAYTVAELGEILLMLVEKYTVYIFPKDLKFYHGRDEFGTMEATSEAELRAEMLIRALRHIDVKLKC